MKSLKIIGLAAIAAMALMAVVASSASAAKVCSTAGTGAACLSGHGKVYTGAVVAKNSGVVTLNVTNSEGKVINTVTSEESVVEGSITNGETGVGNLTKLTFNKLKSSLCSEVTAKTSASVEKPWSSSVTTELATENTNGTMTTSGVTGEFTCTFLGFPVTCKYETASASTKVDGSDTAPKVTATNVSLKTETGGNASVCGTSADWTGTYNVTTPSSLFVE